MTIRDALAGPAEAARPGVAGQTLLHAAGHAAGQEAVKPWRETLPADQWFDIKYEDFVREPEAQLKRLCAVLDEDYSDERLRFHATEGAQRRGRSKDDKAVAEPVADKPIGIYKDLLSLRGGKIDSDTLFPIFRNGPRSADRHLIRRGRVARARRGAPLGGRPSSSSRRGLAAPG